MAAKKICSDAVSNKKMNHMLAKSATTKPPVPMPNTLAAEGNQALKLMHWSCKKASKLLPEALHTNNVQTVQLEL